MSTVRQRIWEAVLKRPLIARQISKITGIPAENVTVYAKQLYDLGCINRENVDWRTYQYKAVKRRPPPGRGKWERKPVVAKLYRGRHVARPNVPIECAPLVRL